MEDKQTCQVSKDILFFAMRYSLGRSTFSPLITVENIKHNIDQFHSWEIELLIRDIKEQASLGGYGMDCDERLWLDFKSYLEDKIAIRESEVV